MSEDAKSRRVADEIAVIERSFDITLPVEPWREAIEWLLSHHRWHQAKELLLKRLAVDGTNPTLAFLLAQACHLSHQPRDAVTWLYRAETGAVLPDASRFDAIAIEMGAAADQAVLNRLKDSPDSVERQSLINLLALWGQDPAAGATFISELEIDQKNLVLNAFIDNRLIVYSEGNVDLLHQVSLILFRRKRYFALELIVQKFANHPHVLADENWAAVAHSNVIRVLNLTLAFDHGRQSVRYFVERSTGEELLKVAQNLRFMVHDCVDISPQCLRLFLERLWIAERAKSPARRHNWSPSPEDQGERVLRVGVLTEWLGSVYEFSITKYRDRNAIQIFAFSYLNFDQSDPRHSEFYDDIFVVDNLDDDELSELIVSLRIDILIDLTGQGSWFARRVLDYKPAPVQVVWTTKLVTTGNDRVDWFLADTALVPPEHDDHFTEKVWRYPQVITPWTSTFSDIPPAPPPRRVAGRITFGSPASAFKLTMDCITLWRRVVDQVPGSRFIYSFRATNDSQFVSLTQRFLTAGFKPDQFLIIESINDGDLQRVLSYVDIALDSAPFGCNRTAAECLEQGVPLLTQWGDRLIGRYTATQLAALGLDGFIAADAEEFVAKAVALANDPDQLDHLRATLPGLVARSPIVDPVHAMRVLETALRGMWQHYLAQSRPQA
ncbi:MAG: hypothetical protein SF002_16990 [Alphaproteobacteria bacterium]|nr:hypothetical protein [Alphaproteobacteria bacterium]